MSERYFEGISRRKESTARVRVSSGSGKFVVNEKEIEAYTTTVLLQSAEAIALAASIEEALENICNLLDRKSVV